MGDKTVILNKRRVKFGQITCQGKDRRWQITALWPWNTKSFLISIKETGRKPTEKEKGTWLWIWVSNRNLKTVQSDAKRTI